VRAAFTSIGGSECEEGAQSMTDAGLMRNHSHKSEPARRARLAASIAFVAIASAIVVWFGGPPRALPADAPVDLFSAARAMRHVEAIAVEPHPLGSPQGARVREYIIAQLAALGLEPEIQRPRNARPAPSPGSTPDRAPALADVQNIVARWRGSGPAGKKALLLSAHYDSVAQGPGAGDDAAGVAAILETLRALKTGTEPVRDLIILINEGEEAGLYGAIVFADEHPWAEEVGVALNLDARGNSGPSYMFETSNRNGWLVEQFARAVPYPLATSLTGDIYALMPNDTDLTIYKSRGIPGLNFAFIGGLGYYHSPEDTPANLDPRTLQHEGGSLLALTQRLSRLDLDQVRAADVVYFSVLEHFVIVYPVTWAMPIFWCAAAAFVGVTVLGLARKRVRLLELLVGFAGFLAAALVAALVVGVLLVLLRRWSLPLVRYDIALLTAFSAVAALITFGVFAPATWRWSWEGLGLGALGWWLALAAVTSLFLPGASYAFVWPLLAILAGLAVSFVFPRGSRTALAAAWLAAIPLVVIHMTIVPGIFHALNLTLAPALMVPIVLLATALLPLAGQALGRFPLGRLQPSV
jgi:hypothetical protein